MPDLKNPKPVYFPHYKKKKKKKKKKKNSTCLFEGNDVFETFEEWKNNASNKRRTLIFSWEKM